MKHLKSMGTTFPLIPTRNAVMGISTFNETLPTLDPNKSATAAAAAKARQSKCVDVMICFTIRPHLPPCHATIIAVPAQARAREVLDIVWAMFMAERERMGLLWGPIPSDNVGDYMLCFLDGPVGGDGSPLTGPSAGPQPQPQLNLSDRGTADNAGAAMASAVPNDTSNGAARKYSSLGGAGEGRYEVTDSVVTLGLPPPTAGAKSGDSPGATGASSPLSRTNTGGGGMVPSAELTMNNTSPLLEKTLSSLSNRKLHQAINRHRSASFGVNPISPLDGTITHFDDEDGAGGPEDADAVVESSLRTVGVDRCDEIPPNAYLSRYVQNNPDHKGKHGCALVHLMLRPTFFALENLVFSEYKTRVVVLRVQEESLDALMNHEALCRALAIRAAERRVHFSKERQVHEDRETQRRSTILSLEASTVTAMFDEFWRRFRELEVGMIAQYRKITMLREAHDAEMVKLLAATRKRPVDKDELLHHST